MTTISHIPAEILVEGEWLRVDSHVCEPGGYLRFAIGISEYLIHESRGDQYRLLAPEFSPRALDRIAADVRGREVSAFEPGAILGRMSKLIGQHTEDPDHGEAEATAKPEPKAESLVGRLLKAHGVVYRITDDREDECRDDESAVYAELVNGFRADLCVKRWALPEMLLPVHAVAVPHDRPVVWLTRLDLNLDVVNWSHDQLRRRINLNRRAFDGCLRCDGSMLADYLPAA